MKISVILPTRNRINCLEKCIKSLEEQTKKPDEVIIIGHVNDLDTEKFIKTLSSSLKINYLKTKGGSCKSRNLGIKNASGEILVFIDDDCILEDNYIKNLNTIFQNNNLNVLVGYVFDIVDLNTPGLIKNGEIEYIKENKDKPFFKMIINEMELKNKGKSNLTITKPKLLKNFLLRYSRIIVKSIILLEWPVKGKILPSGWRSEMPDIKNINGLEKVEWFYGGNFAVKKHVVEEYPFNNDLEIHPYALGDDLELAARIGKKYDIVLSKDLMVFHFRSAEGLKVDNKQRFETLIITLYRIANLRGNMFAFWWSVIGVTLSRIVLLPINYTVGVSEIRGIFEGIKKMKTLI